MVFEDLSGYSTKKSPRLAPVSDRMLSLLVDVALFSPLFSLCLAGLLRRLQSRYYSAPDSGEFWILLGLVVFGALVLSVVAQGLFWSVLGATPGQMFFQLRVVRKSDRRFVSLHTAWLRALLFWIECACLGLPFLEVFSHPERRVFHDRACESEVITLKAKGMDSPQPLETRFVHTLFTGTLALTTVVLFATFNQYYRQVQVGAYHEAELSDEGYLCQEVPKREDHPRLDTALAMYMTGDLSTECLTSEIDFAFWKGESSDQAWASLATAIMNVHDKAEEDAYLTQTCDKDAKGEPCEMAKWLKSDRHESLAESDSWTRTVMNLQNLERTGDSDDWEDELANLPEDFDLPEFIESQRLKLLWSRNQINEVRGGYQVVWDQMGPTAQKNLAENLCFSELTRDCSVKNYSYCRDLETSLRKSPPAEVKPEWIIALAEEKTCRKSTDPQLMEFANDLDPQSDWGQLLLAVLPESEWTDSQRVSELRRLAFNPHSAETLRSRALVQLLRLSKDATDLEKGQKLLAEQSLPGARDLQTLWHTLAKKQESASGAERVPASEGKAR